MQQQQGTLSLNQRFIFIYLNLNKTKLLKEYRLYKERMEMVGLFLFHFFF